MKVKQKKNIVLKYILLLFAVMALLSSIIANDKPLICQYNNDIYIPVCSDRLSQMINAQQSFMDVNYDWAIYPIIPYSGKTLDDANAQFVSPLGSQNSKSIYYRHWFGTDALGHDVLAVIIHGTTTVAFIAIIVMSIACSLGLLIGLLAGYFADVKLKISFIALLFILGGLYLTVSNMWLNASTIFANALSIVCFLALPTIYFLVIVQLNKRQVLPTKWSIYYSPDIWLNRFIEFISVLPVLIILIIVSAAYGSSLLQSIILISLFNWTSIAKIIRAETMKLKQQQYIESAKTLGLSDKRIILKHILPNVLPILWISIIIGLADTVLLESLITFLGLGIEPEQTTWGSLLASGRMAPSAWWLIVFPGLALFAVSYSLKRLGKSSFKSIYFNL